jgi:hypothetical protein
MNSTSQWKAQIDSLLIKLSVALHIKKPKTDHITSITHGLFFYFHMIMSYGIIFWGAPPLSINIFGLHQEIKNSHKY